MIHKLPHGPVPLKPALIRPTDNFKRPVAKKVSIEKKREKSSELVESTVIYFTLLVEEYAMVL